MKAKLFSIVGLALAAGLFFASCNSSETAQATPAPVATATPVPVVEVAPGSSGKVIDVTLEATTWKFTPDEIDAAPGDTVRVTLKNTNGTHGVMFDGFPTEILEGTPVDIQPTKAGTIQYYCTIECGHGHDAMVGNLVVQ